VAQRHQTLRIKRRAEVLWCKYLFRQNRPPVFTSDIDPRHGNPDVMLRHAQYAYILGMNCICTFIARAKHGHHAQFCASEKPPYFHYLSVS